MENVSINTEVSSFIQEGLIPAMASSIKMHFSKGLFFVSKVIRSMLFLFFKYNTLKLFSEDFKDLRNDNPLKSSDSSRLL